MAFLENTLWLQIGGPDKCWELIYMWCMNMQTPGAEQGTMPIGQAAR